MNHSRYAELVKKMNPIDDTFFQKMAESLPFCQEILRVFLGDEGLTVTKVRPQESLKNLQGRSVILDAYCVSNDGKHFNVEVQKSDDDNHQKRVRYNSSCITTNITDPGSKFENVPDVCIVYISVRDIFKSGRSLYHVDRTIRETEKTVYNGLSEIYINAEVKDGSKASSLMTVFTDNDAYDTVNFPETSKRKRHFKEDAKGVVSMCKITEEIRAEGKAEGKAEVLKILVDDGIITLKDAALTINVTIEQLQNMFSDLETAQ